MVGTLTRAPWVSRKVKGLLRRLIHRKDMLVLRAPPADSVQLPPKGYNLLRVGSICSSDFSLVKAAMQAAGEPAGLEAPRFAHGEEFFAWVGSEGVVCFGWMTRRDRIVVSKRLAEAPGRYFLYNFHTRSEYRGRGLYPALLLAIRYALGCKGAKEIIIDVKTRNQSSMRGIVKAGFVPVVKIFGLSVFSGLEIAFKCIVLDSEASALFVAE